MFSCQTPKIFSSWDSFVSWNRWATLYSNGLIPIDNQHYPLALPAQWSIAYVFYGDVIEYLPKATIPLFLYSSIFTLFEIGIVKKNYGFLVSSFLIIFYFLGTGFVNEGYVDIPVTCIAFGSFILLLSAEGKNQLVLAAIICISSALVKQAGLFAVIAFPIFAYFFFFKKFKTGKKSFIKFIVFYFIFSLLFLGAFYITTQVLIKKGINHSEIEYVTNGIYYGKPIYIRLLETLKSCIFSVRILFFIFLFFAFSSKNKVTKSLALFGFIYFLIWACFYCYDLRNGFLSWPFIIFSGCCGFYEILNKNYEKIKTYFRLNKKKFISILVLIFCGLVLFVDLNVSKEKVLNRQELAKNWRGGDAFLLIDNFYSNLNKNDFYLSNYQPLGWVSEDSFVKKNYIGYHFSDIESFKEKIKKESIKYACFYFGDIPPEFKNYIKEQISCNNFKILFGTSKISFVEIKNLE